MFSTWMGDHSSSVAEPELPGAATFRVELEPEPIFLLAGAAPAPAALFGKQERKALLL